MAALAFNITIGFVATIVECNKSHIKARQKEGGDLIKIRADLIPENLRQIGNRIKWTKKGFVLA